MQTIDIYSYFSIGDISAEICFHLQMQTTTTQENWTNRQKKLQLPTSENSRKIGFHAKEKSNNIWQSK